MQLLRLGTGFGFGIVITLGLFVLMSYLIKMDEVKIDDSNTIKIGDFTMPETEIKENLDDELPDQPDEVQAPPPEVQSEDVEIDLPDAGLNIATGTGDFQLDISNEGGFARDTDLIPVYVPEPRYPPRAARTGKGGYAVVSVTVTETGGVTNVQMLEEWPEGFGFGRSALKAAAKLKYNPRVIDGKAVPVPGVLYKFTFTMAK